MKFRAIPRPWIPAPEQKYLLCNFKISLNEGRLNIGTYCNLLQRQVKYEGNYWSKEQVSKTYDKASNTKNSQTINTLVKNLASKGSDEGVDATVNDEEQAGLDTQSHYY